jgi:hypothetical protein
MTTTVGGKQMCTKSSGHKNVVPPAMSMIPPMTPATPTGVPAPFVYMGTTSTASGTSSKLTIGGGETVLEGNTIDVDSPGNQPSQPAPLHDLVSQVVNSHTTID